MTPAQLERWRGAGILPVNERQWLGQGRGSTSHTPEDAFAVAAALALAVRPGRPLHEAVLRIFTVHPRFGEQFVATDRLPLAEGTVRAALEWHIHNRSDAVTRRMKRAISDASTQDEAEDAVMEISRRSFTAAFRRQRRRQRQGQEPPALLTFHNETEVEAQVIWAAARVLGPGAFGVDGVYDALSDGPYPPMPSTSAAPEPLSQPDLKAFLDILRDKDRKRELEGLPPTFGPGINFEVPSADTTVEALRRTDYATICRMRDLFTYLGEAAVIFQIARRVIPDDPDVRHLERARVADPRVDFYLHLSAAIGRAPASDAWQHLATLLIAICTDADERERLGEACAAIDPALDDPHGMSARTLAAWKAPWSVPPENG